MNVAQLSQCVAESENDEEVAKNLGEFNRKVKPLVTILITALYTSPVKSEVKSNSGIKSNNLFYFQHIQSFAFPDITKDQKTVSLDFILVT